jgi:acetylornithine deacetylase
VQESLQPEMRKVDPASGFTIQPLSSIPVLDTGPESEVVALAQELSGSGEIGKVSFGTEASQFHAAGIPTVVCGPGSILQAHKPNEYVTVEQINRCDEFLRRLMGRVCAR